MPQRAQGDSEESSYTRNQRAMFAAERIAQNRMSTMTTEDEFVQKMNDAAWKTAGSSASDKIQ